MTDKPNAKVTRHPLAIAWDEWINSLDGARCSALYTLKEEKHLMNRLHHAYDAAYEVGQSRLAREVLKVATNSAWSTSNHDVGAHDVEECATCATATQTTEVSKSLRELFSRLGISVDEGGE